MDYISIGKILNFHGINGEAKVGFSNKDRILSAKEVFIGELKTKLTINAVRFHKNFALVKFEEINSINELLEFKGKPIFLDKKNVEKLLDKNEFLIDDLIGLKVFDNEENFIGQVEEVQKSPANDIIGIKSSEKENLILVPFVSSIVPIVDIKSGKIIIKPIEGLL